ncbi:hypothetical protein CCACVL1_21116 [Corchorus capsularis]|uniref:Uncharacterized protein n=1 Tax=Corchorus capsularis TaxID=210143 RepID=A0A1R3H848_COCAP|nr:hypothetical protein CCACVL1_21116 [Corchorus capsularis]
MNPSAIMQVGTFSRSIETKSSATAGLITAARDNTEPWRRDRMPAGTGPTGAGGSGIDKNSN